MEIKRLGRPSLALQAERLLANDSILSSSTSEERGENILSVQDENKAPYSITDNTFLSKKSISKLKKPEKSVKINDTLNPKVKKSKSKSKTRLHSKTTLHIPESIGCQKEKFQLRNEIEKMQETIEVQQKKLKNLYKKIIKGRDETKNLTIEAFESRKKDVILKGLQEKLQDFQNNELHLIQELNDQQKISKEALSKLYELQEESIKEIDKAKNYYKDYYNRHSQEEIETINGKICMLENQIKLLEDEKYELNLNKTNEEQKYERVISQVKRLEDELSIKTLENERVKNEVERIHRENDRLKAENEKVKIENEKVKGENERLKLDNEKNINNNQTTHDEKLLGLTMNNDRLIRENEKLKRENEELKIEIIDIEEGYKKEQKRLRETISKLQEEVIMDKNKDDNDSIRDLQEIINLKRKIEELNKENEELSIIIRDKDLNYKNQLELINDKVKVLQGDLKKLPTYEEKIDELTKEVVSKNVEISKLKSYYKEKLNKRKREQDIQKQEWSSIYNELASEIRQLKIEIDEPGIVDKKKNMNQRKY